MLAKNQKMKKILLIFGVLSLLIFIRPVLGFNKDVSPTDVGTTIAIQDEAAGQEDGVYTNAFHGIQQF